MEKIEFVNGSTIEIIKGRVGRFVGKPIYLANISDDDNYITCSQCEQDTELIPYIETEEDCLYKCSCCCELLMLQTIKHEF